VSKFDIPSGVKFDFVTDKAGGDGAFREFVEVLIPFDPKK